MTTQSKQEILDIITDIRNKLGPFWILPTLIIDEEPKSTNPIIDKIILESAQIADEQKSVITDNLNKIVDLINS